MELHVALFGGAQNHVALFDGPPRELCRQRFLDLLISYLHQGSLLNPTDNHNNPGERSFIHVLVAHLRRQVLVDSFNTQGDAGDGDNGLQHAYSAPLQANIPLAPVTGEDEVISFRGPSSSVYSRDIDGNTIHLQQSSHMPSIGANSATQRSPTTYSPVSRSDEISLGFTTTAGTSASASSETNERRPAKSLFGMVKEHLRRSSMISTSPTTSESASASAQTEEQNRPDARPSSVPSSSATQQQTRQKEQHQQIMRIITLGRLRRRVNSLDFESDEMVILRSDLTTLVPLPRQGVKGANPIRNPEIDYQFFRERLARLVHRRLALLKLEARAGSVRALEDWYTEVADLIGWRDQSEEDMAWGWRENDGFF